MMPHEQEDRDFTIALVTVLLMFLLIFCSATYGQNYPTDDLDLPVLPPTYRSPEERALQPIPDVAPPESTEGGVEPRDEPPIIYYGVEVIEAGESIIFVLDASGSMAESVESYVDQDGQVVQGGTHYDKAASELVRVLRTLPANSSFGVIIYECGPWPWRNGDLLPCTEENKAAVEPWILNFRAGSETGTMPALLLALEIAPDVVVLLTDGYPSCWAGGRQGDALDMAGWINQANTERCVIYVFGIGLVPAGPSWNRSTGSRISDTWVFCSHVANDSGGFLTEVP